MADTASPKVKWLAPIAEIRPAELVPALLSLVWIFLALSANYIFKPIRGEALKTLIGVDNKPYAILATAAFTLVFSYFYGRVVSRTPRKKLIVSTYVVFIVCVAIFGVLFRTPSKWLGYVFWVWLSTFNVMVVSQFWALSADVWSKEEGKRLFPFIGLGTVSGGVAGSALTSFAERLATWQLIFVAAAMLGVCTGLALYMLAFAERKAGAQPAAPSSTPEPAKPAGSREPAPNALAMVARSPFLRLIAVMTLLLNVVNSNNEWILDKLMPDEGARAAYATFYLIQNVATVLIQAVLTRRIQERYGARGALFFLPVIGLLGGSIFLIIPSLFVIRWEKIFENATDYSIQSNTRELLYLPTSKLEKYAGKNVNDTFVVRSGDALAAGSILMAVNVMLPALGESLGLRTLVAIDLVLGLVWIFVVNRLGKLHKQKMEGLAQAA